MTKTEAEKYAQRQNAAIKHGLRGRYVTQGDETGLQPHQRGRLVELRDNLGARDGVIELLIERAARAELIAEIGESYLTQAAQDGENIYTSDRTRDVLKRLATFQAEARRCLTTLLPYLQEPHPVTRAEAARISEILSDDLK
jgi:chorismate mutase